MHTSRTRSLSTCSAAVLMTLLASVAVAQTASTVLLESTDKSVSLSGELIEAANGQYSLQTPAGIFELDINGVTCTGNACPSVEPNFAASGLVRLVSTDGKVNITGNIVTIFNDQYVIGNSVAGIINIDTDSVMCSGPGCPVGLRFANELVEQAAADQPAESTPEGALENNSAQIAGSNQTKEVTPVDESESSAETRAFNPLDARISFSGSSIVGLGLLPELLDDYADTLDVSVVKNAISETETHILYNRPDGTELSSVYVKTADSREALVALETKAAVFGMTSRPIETDDARRLAVASGIDIRNSEFETVVALDSLALVTHPSNPLREMNMDEVGAIYRGQIDNWSQVGGPDAPITVLSSESGSSARGIFERVVFGGAEPALSQRVVFPSSDNPDIAAAVKADPNAIAYVGFASSEGLNRLDLTSSCGVISSPNSFSVKAEEYPLTRRLYLYHRADNSPAEAEQFLQYVLSPDADNAVAKSNFVNFAVERKPLDISRAGLIYDDLDLQSEQQVQLARQMLIDLSLWDRLSTTVRFSAGSGSFQLDKKALNDVNRLVNVLDDMPEGTRIAVVGFTDDVGTFEQNLRLSERRAQNVANRIFVIAGDRLSNIELSIKSFSELLPSVCNDGAAGRAINRRVEIWVEK